MDVGAAGEHVDAGREHLLGQRGGALAGAALALAEELGLGDLERHGLAGDHVHERSALVTREHARVDLLGVSSLQRIIPPRAPPSVLCVVVVTTSE